MLRGLFVRRAASVGLALAGLLLAACGTGTEKEFTGSRLDQPYDTADIALTDTSGRPYSLVADTDKPLTLVFFGYTNCADYCPMVMNNLATAMNRLDDADRTQVDVVLVPTDPARDAETAMRASLDKYNKAFIGLTGELDQVIELGNSLHVYVNDGKKLPTGGRDLGGHSTITLAIDGSNRAIALWNQETSSTEFAADLHTLLTED